MTPFGPAVWTYALGLSTNGLVTARITEWQATSLHDIPGLLFFGSAMAVVVLIARRGARTAWPTLAWLAVFFVIGAYRRPRRGVVAAGRGGGDRRRPRHRAGSRIPPTRNRWARRSCAGSTSSSRRSSSSRASPCSPSGARPNPGSRRRAASSGWRRPGITGALRTMARPGDHVFNPQPWGSWFEFALPDLPVGIDSRIELFPASVWDAYEGVIAGVDGWQAQLDTWDVAARGRGEARGSVRSAAAAAGWRTVYADEDGSVLRHPIGRHAASRRDRGTGQPRDYRATGDRHAPDW